MDIESTILAGVVVYVALMIGIGVYASRKTHSVAEFAVAGRSLPLWLCTATVVATWFGGGIMIGVAGAAYGGGMLGVIADPFGASMALFLVGLLVVRLLRRLRLFSFIEIVEQRFGHGAAVIASLGSMLSSLLWVAAMLVAFGLIFETMTGVPLPVGIVGGAFVIIIYTSIGGMLAVALTDFVQMAVIAIGLVTLLVVVWIDVGGWAAVGPRLPENTFRMLPLENTLDDWLVYLRAWLIMGLADVASQSLLQRGLSAKSERVAQNAFYLAGVIYIGLGMIPVMLGIIGSVTMPDLANPESIVPTLALEHLHPVAIAVFVGALLAAIMSSCDSALLAAATVFSTNILPRITRDPTERLSLNVARLGIPVGGVIAIVGALNAQVIFETMLDANMLMLAAVIAPFMLGLWWKKANRAGALAGMGAGIATWLSASFLWPGLPSDLLGLVACVVTMLVVTPLTQSIDPPRRLLDHDGNEVALEDRLGVLRG